MSETKKLGFGMMRLPIKLTGIDIEQVKEMVDLFMAAGFTYFDTAYVYPGSEAAAKKALVERFPRESFTLATKINAAIPGLTEKMVKNQFETSLNRTGAGYFDYYLLHTLMDRNVRKYDKYELWNFAEQKKAEGLVRNVGFSFHDGPELLDRLLTEHPEVDFVQLQINYADWENEKIASRRNYEVARAHGKQIVVMEPVKGGKLADPPKQVKKLMKDYVPDASFASWAIRFVASLDGILTVLSGMSNVEQMRDNLSFMQSFQPLNAEERAIIRKAQEIYRKSAAVPCTGCGYCKEGCPKSIAIPTVLETLNLHLVSGQTAQGKEAYDRMISGGFAPASACIGCKRCEGICPQHIGITEALKQAAALYE